MTIATTQLGSPVSTVRVAKVAHGLMLMTWKTPVVPDEQAFAAIKAGLDLVGPGEKVLINSSEFYGVNPREANLHLLARFFTKYPEYKDKAFLSVKGGLGADNYIPDSSPANLRRSVEACIKALNGAKKIDLFECARVDSRVSIEDAITTLAGFVKEGLFDYIGVSETSANTLKRAHAVHPITAAEIEISPWSYEEETKKVIATAKELGVTVIGYSPLGRGFLTGQIKREDLDSSDFRSHHPRFTAEAFDANQKFVDLLNTVSGPKGITNAQLCIAWVASLGSHVIPLPGSSAEKRTLENFAAADVSLTPEELRKLNEGIDELEVIGDRYPEGMPVWG